MEKLFKNKTVLISGGLGDIGFAIALEFAKHGANVALCDLIPEHVASEFLKPLKQWRILSTYHQVDVTDAKAVDDWVIEIENTIGLASIIIPNAATVTLAGIQDLTSDQWSKELRVNLDGAFHLAQSATNRLLYHKQPGRVAFIGSWAAYTPHIHIPAYCVAKAGLRMLSKCMALELAPFDILVNELAPGYVEAGLSGDLWKKDPGASEIALQKVPVKRVMSAQQVAEQVLLMCHPNNIHMTGSTILMDGGLSLKS